MKEECINPILQGDLDSKRVFSWKDIIVYTLLFVLMYIISLAFIFPGYLSPFSPHHSDILDYPFDYQGYTPLTFIKMVRPVGMLLTGFFGLFGGYIGITLWCIVIHILSMIQMIFIYTHITKRKAWLPSIAAYFFLYTSSASFYLYYTYDIYTIISLPFMLTSCILWYRRSQVPLTSLYIWTGILSLLCFLSKETYIISFMLFYVFQFFLSKANRKSALICSVIVLLMAAISFIQSRYANSVFVALSNDANSPYFTSLSLGNLLSTFRYYLNGIKSPGILIIIVTIAVWKVINREKIGWEFFIWVLIGICAYVPYSVLPSHKVPHYFPISHVMVFSATLMLHPLKNISSDLCRKMQKGFMNCALLIACTLSVFFYSINAQGYADAMGWNRFEPAFSVTLSTMDDVLEELKPNDIVLVEGLEEYRDHLFFSTRMVETIFGKDVIFDVLINDPESDLVISRSSIVNIVTKPRHDIVYTARLVYGEKTYALYRESSKSVQE